MYALTLITCNNSCYHQHHQHFKSSIAIIISLLSYTLWAPLAVILYTFCLIIEFCRKLNIYCIANVVSLHLIYIKLSIAYNYSCIMALKDFSFIVKTHKIFDSNSISVNFIA